MADLTLRTVKGEPLTNQEVDDNFSNLNNDKIEVGGDLGGTTSAPLVVAIRGIGVNNTTTSFGTGTTIVFDGTEFVPTDVGANQMYVTSYTTGTGTHNCKPSTIYVEIFCTGGGGAGGSADGDASSGSAGGGGGGGGTAHKFLTREQADGGTYTVGAGGTPGSVSGGTGGSGGASTYAKAGITTISGGGGSGGTGTGSAYAPASGMFNGGSGGTNSGFDFNYQGMEGAPGIALSAAIATAGNGGDSLWGGGANGNASNAAVNAAGAAGAYGGGGAGARSQTSTTGFAGGAGGSGLIRIIEYRALPGVIQ